MVDNPDFTPSQVGGLFTFLARQLAKPDNTLFVNRNLFDQVSRHGSARSAWPMETMEKFSLLLCSSVFLSCCQVLEFLCCPDDDSRHTERQQVHTQSNARLLFD